MKTPWIVLLCLVALGCGPDRTTLVLNLSGLTAAVRTLRVTATLDDQLTTTQEYTAAAQVGLRLQRGAKGKVDLGVEGLTATGCVALRGEARGYADGAVRIDIAVMMRQASPPCAIVEMDMRSSQIPDLRPTDLAPAPDLRPTDLAGPADLRLSPDLRGM